MGPDKDPGPGVHIDFGPPPVRVQVHVISSRYGYLVIAAGGDHETGRRMFAPN